MSQDHASITPIYFNQTRTRLIIVSKWYAKRGHFDRQANQSRECGGEHCAVCRDGQGSHPLFYAVGEDPAGLLRLVCLRKRHSELVHLMQLNHTDGQGQEIVAYKTGPAPNSPIKVDLGGIWDCTTVDVDAFMECVLLKPLLVKSPTLKSATPPLQERRASVH